MTLEYEPAGHPEQLLLEELAYVPTPHAVTAVAPAAQ
jgi:hypothetical protein